MASWISRVRFDVTTTIGGATARIVPELGNGHLEVRQHLEEIGLERLVGAIELVDQQHRRRAVVRRQRFEQRPAQQEARGEDVVGELATLHALRRLGKADLDHLARVVPLVDRRRDVETFVALQPQQLAAQPPSEHLRDLGLAHARLAFEEQGPTELQREKDRGGESAVGDVVLRGEEVDGGVDGSRNGQRGHEEVGNGQDR